MGKFASTYILRLFMYTSKERQGILEKG